MRPVPGGLPVLWSWSLSPPPPPTKSLFLSIGLLTLCGVLACGDKDVGPENVNIVYLDDFTGDVETRCTAESEDGTVNYSGVNVEDYLAIGYNGSTTPPSSSVYTKRTSGACTGTTSARSPTAPSEHGDWDATGGIGTYEQCADYNCDGGPDSCSGVYEVWIEPTNVNDCSDYNDGKIENELIYITAIRSTDSDHACSAGSGTFTLMPVGRADRDGDGSETVVFLPFLTDGDTGLTANAWISSLTVVEDEGYDLYLADPAFTFSIGSSDTITGLSSNATLVSNTHSFSSGTHAGYAPFVIEEMDPADMADLEVDMSWTCGSGATSLSWSGGYVMDLDAMSCGVDQELILRVFDSPNRIRWEVKGTGQWGFVTPTINGMGGREFDLVQGKLRVTGTLTSWDSTEAEVDFDTIEYDSADLCTEGSYTLPAE